MKLDVTRVNVWAASIKDRSGALAEKLAALAQAGANLGFVLARRAPDKPGTGVVFLTPLKAYAAMDSGRGPAVCPACMDALREMTGR